jgi:alanine racemase
MAHITINKQYFHHNLQQITKQTASIHKIAIVLKDNAYGHGLHLIAKMASEANISHAVVRNNEEAIEIRDLFSSILVLANSPYHDKDFTYVINSLESLPSIPKGTKVSLKVDTGMHRNGISEAELEETLEIIKTKGLLLQELMTHYRSADVLSSEFFWQQKIFERIQKRVKIAGFKDIKIHSHNSASILRQKHFDEDLVRVGIALYGYNELPSIFDSLRLKPILCLFAKKIASRWLEKGERLGYSATFTAPKKMLVSTYDMGYGDGLDRAKASRIACGGAILGRVSMDSITIEGDEQYICILDDAQETAKAWGTLSYEVLTSLKASIPKKVI